MIVAVVSRSRLGSLVIVAIARLHLRSKIGSVPVTNPDLELPAKTSVLSATRRAAVRRNVPVAQGTAARVVRSVLSLERQTGLDRAVLEAAASMEGVALEADVPIALRTALRRSPGVKALRRMLRSAMPIESQVPTPKVRHAVSRAVPSLVVNLSGDVVHAARILGTMVHAGVRAVEVVTIGRGVPLAIGVRAVRRALAGMRMINPQRVKIIKEISFYIALLRLFPSTLT